MNEPRLTETELLQAIGQVIRERRKSKKLRLQDLADATGMSLGYLSQVELGRNSASVEVLYRCCLALEMKMSDLFTVVQRTNTNF